MRITVHELFNSGVSAAKFIDQMKGEIESYGEMENWRYIEWINILEQLIYSEIVCYESSCELSPAENDINYCDLRPPEGVAPPRFSDIFAVRADDLMLSHGRDVDSDMVYGTYFDRGGRLAVNVKGVPKKVRVYFRARPRPLTGNMPEKREIHVPLEFIDLFRSRIRGEYYKLVNEDALCAKWISEYNTILENFKEWCKRREELYK